MTPSEKTSPQTAYVVLVQSQEDERWGEMTDEPIVASTAHDAIRTAAEGTVEGLTFVAVPARSWKPRTRKVEQVTKESWS